MNRAAVSEPVSRLPWILTLGAVLFVIGSVSAVIELRSHDFIALYAAASLVLAGNGAAILDPQAVLAAEHAAEPTRTVLLPWIHPPFVALLVAPLAGLPIVAASVVMTAISCMCLVFAAYRLGVLAAASQRVRLFALALFAPPATIALTQGQTSPWVLALLALSVGASPFWRGLVLGLTLVRPQTFALFAVAALTGWRATVGVVSGAAIVGLGSLLVVGPDGMVRYGNSLVDAGTWSVSGAQGVRAAVSWVGPAIALGLPAVGLAATGVSLAIGAIVVVRSRGPARIVAASAWAMLGSPHVLLHDVVLSYPAVAARCWSTRRLVLIAGGGYAAAILHQAGIPVAPFWLLGVARLRTHEPAGDETVSTRGPLAV